MSATIPIKASTQEHLDVFDVSDNIIIQKNGACSLILQVTAINFGLLSELEQDAIIYAYAGLLNSLTFPIQIMVRSTIKDVTDYIRLIKKQEQKQKKPLLLDQLKKYRKFIETIVKDNRVLDKKFYVCIPFSSLELGLSNTLSSSIKKSKKLPYPKHHILERAKMSLFPKRDHLIRQFSRIGLQSRQLNTQQLLELLYGLYNEESVGQKLISSKEYGSPIVFKNPQQKTGNKTTSQRGDDLPLKQVAQRKPAPQKKAQKQNVQPQQEVSANKEQAKTNNPIENANQNTPGNKSQASVLYQSKTPKKTFSYDKGE
jgi:hypothetical protein